MHKYVKSPFLFWLTQMVFGFLVLVDLGFLQFQIWPYAWSYGDISGPVPSSYFLKFDFGCFILLFMGTIGLMISVWQIGYQNKGRNRFIRLFYFLIIPFLYFVLILYG